MSDQQSQHADLSQQSESQPPGQPGSTNAPGIQAPGAPTPGLFGHRLSIGTGASSSEPSNDVHLVIEVNSPVGQLFAEQLLEDPQNGAKALPVRVATLILVGEAKLGNDVEDEVTFGSVVFAPKKLYDMASALLDSGMTGSPADATVLRDRVTAFIKTNPGQTQTVGADDFIPTTAYTPTGNDNVALFQVPLKSLVTPSRTMEPYANLAAMFPSMHRASVRRGAATKANMEALDTVLTQVQNLYPTFDTPDQAEEIAALMTQTGWHPALVGDVNLKPPKKRAVLVELNARVAFTRGDAAARTRLTINRLKLQQFTNLSAVVNDSDRVQLRTLISQLGATLSSTALFEPSLENILGLELSLEDHVHVLHGRPFLTTAERIAAIADSAKNQGRQRESLLAAARSAGTNASGGSVADPVSVEFLLKSPKFRQASAAILQGQSDIQVLEIAFDTSRNDGLAVFAQAALKGKAGVPDGALRRVAEAAANLSTYLHACITANPDGTPNTLKARFVVPPRLLKALTTGDFSKMDTVLNDALNDVTRTSGWRPLYKQDDLTNARTLTRNADFAASVLHAVGINESPGADGEHTYTVSGVYEQLAIATEEVSLNMDPTLAYTENLDLLRRAWTEAGVRYTQNLNAPPGHGAWNPRLLSKDSTSIVMLQTCKKARCDSAQQAQAEGKVPAAADTTTGASTKRKVPDSSGSDRGRRPRTASPEPSRTERTQAERFTDLVEKLPPPLRARFTGLRPGDVVEDNHDSLVRTVTRQGQVAEIEYRKAPIARLMGRDSRRICYRVVTSISKIPGIRHKACRCKSDPGHRHEDDDAHRIAAEIHSTIQADRSGEYYREKIVQ